MQCVFGGFPVGKILVIMSCGLLFVLSSFLAFFHGWVGLFLTSGCDCLFGIFASVKVQLSTVNGEIFADFKFVHFKITRTIYSCGKSYES